MTNGAQKRSSVLVALAVAVSCCTGPRDVSELYGTYVAEYPFGSEKLTLFANGEYLQEITLKDHPKLTTARGRWSYDKTNGYIRLENALVVADGFGKLRQDYDVPPLGDTFLPVNRLFWGKLRICGGEGVDYKKLSGAS